MRRRDPETVCRTAAVAGDWLLTVGACFLAYYIRFNSGWLAAPQASPDLGAFTGMTVLMACPWVWSLHWAGAYGRGHTVSLADEVYRVLVGVAIGSLAAGAVTFLAHALWYSRLVLGIATVLAAVLLSGWHLALRGVSGRLLLRGVGRRRVAIVDAGVAGATVADKLQELGPAFELVGLIAGEGGKQPARPTLPLLGNVTEVDQLALKHELDELWVPPTAVSPAVGLQLIADSEQVGARVRFIPDLFDLIKHRGSLESLRGVQLLTVKYARLTGADRFAKRAVDLLAGTLLLLVLSPLMLLVAFLVRVTSRGPALYAQERVGLDGTRFMMLKFRTMRDDAEAESGPVWATEDDPRRTPLGKFLRRTSLDEMPQLLNILRGEMSLVGPRPERPHFVEQFRKKVPRYDDRHRVKGGLTGWAQVNEMRGNTSIMARTLYDLYYIENWSLALDFEILVKTAFEVLFHRQAY